MISRRRFLASVAAIVAAPVAAKLPSGGDAMSRGTKLVIDMESDPRGLVCYDPSNNETFMIGYGHRPPKDGLDGAMRLARLYGMGDFKIKETFTTTVTSSDPPPVDFEAIERRMMAVLAADDEHRGVYPGMMLTKTDPLFMSPAMHAGWMAHANFAAAEKRLAATHDIMESETIARSIRDTMREMAATLPGPITGIYGNDAKVLRAHCGEIDGFEWKGDHYATRSSP